MQNQLNNPTSEVTDLTWSYFAQYSGQQPECLFTGTEAETREQAQDHRQTLKELGYKLKKSSDDPNVHLVTGHYLKAPLRLWIAATPKSEERE